MNEFRLIDSFVQPFRPPPAPLGPGDDCAVLPPTSAHTCVTTDAVVEGVHFTRRTSSLEDVGYKALAVNLSDLAAMGARPRWMLCAVALPKRFSPTDLRRLAAGMAPLAREHCVALLGGNVTSASALSITLTLAGDVPKSRRPLLRSGARSGDVLYLAGAVGEAAAGLRLLEQQARATEVPAKFRRRRLQPRRAQPWSQALVEAQRRPKPLVALGKAIAPFASACVDVSDGLLQDLGHVCAASRLGADVDSRRVPVSAALETFVGSRGAALRDALTGGEDYALLFTVPPSKTAALERALRRACLAAIPVGCMTERRGVRVDGRQWRGRQGFLHFG